MLIWAIFKAITYVKFLSLSDFGMIVLAYFEEVNIETSVQGPCLAHLYSTVLSRYAAVEKRNMTKQPPIKFLFNGH